MESQKDGQVQEIIYSEQKEEHKMNQRVLETTLVNPIKEVEDKICFGFQCKHHNWLKVKTVKLLQSIHANANANANANTIIKDVPNDNNLAMNGGDKLFINFLKSTYAKPLYFKDKITDPVNI
ncbi:hypothetical protein RFI_37926 [Reticulomyxa filosa]|uniref:Uncharacterized protein n=1 Tax=Reticulomyxa filosa TaxID=46433 RepID=X6LFM6_RETFI|nr:hypothetical protein RFI_37926 [Reticulomyxa filosa]|eukprot:ETN99544.1 hypothetical protein RFI_37926 [Reticulomyxa filosa]